MADRQRHNKNDATALHGEPTQPRPRDAQGRELDGHGLPLNGPARARALAEQGIPDPALSADDTPPSGEQGQEG